MDVGEGGGDRNKYVNCRFQELLNMEKNRSVSLQLDGKKGKKAKSKKVTNQEGGAGGEGSSGVKEKCQVM